MAASIYTDELAERICARMEKGEALASICDADDMPNLRTVLRWASDREDFSALYLAAQAAQAERLDAEIDEIAATATDKDSAAAARVKIAAKQWRASKMAPKRFGDRMDVNVDHTFDLASRIARGRQQVLEGRTADQLQSRQSDAIEGPSE